MLFSIFTIEFTCTFPRFLFLNILYLNFLVVDTDDMMPSKRKVSANRVLFILEENFTSEQQNKHGGVNHSVAVFKTEYNRKGHYVQS